MFLIFALNRPDVLPVGDLGVRVGLRDRHGLAELPKPSECHALAEHWRPYRSIASLVPLEGRRYAPARRRFPSSSKNHHRRVASGRADRSLLRVAEERKTKP